MVVSNRALIVAIVFALLVAAVMQWVGAPLTTAAAPAGIVSFEFAGNAARAEAILASWDATASLYAALGLGLDYLFMVAYASAISLACIRVAEAWRGRAPGVARLGWLLAIGQWLAAGLDAVENFALLRLLFGYDAAAWPTVAWWCAAVKFTLVGAGLLFVLIGGSVWLLTRQARSSGTPARP
jgi:hypothetical protein